MIAFRRQIVCAALLLPMSLMAQSQPRNVATSDSLVVTTQLLAAHLSDPSVVVVEVTHMEGPRGPHIPGSRSLFYRNMTVTRDGLSTELPPADSLKALFERLEISATSRVVVYASEAPMATRMLASH